MNSITEYFAKECTSYPEGIIPELVSSIGKRLEQYFEDFISSGRCDTCEKGVYAGKMRSLEFIYEYYYKYFEIPESKRKFREYYEQYKRCRENIDRIALEYSERDDAGNRNKEKSFCAGNSRTSGDSINPERFNKVKRQYNELQRQYNDIYAENQRLKKTLAEKEKALAAANKDLIDVLSHVY